MVMVMVESLIEFLEMERGIQVMELEMLEQMILILALEGDPLEAVEEEAEVVPLEMAEMTLEVQFVRIQMRV